MNEINWDRVIDPNGVLCYVRSGRAWFTTKHLRDQYGDDWDDAPYEHNAESPNGPDQHNPDDWNKDGSPKWHVFFVFFDADAEEPCDGCLNSPYSVMQINSGAVAWLRPNRWGRQFKPIFAGTTYRDFIKRIAEMGGAVYEPVCKVPL